MAEERELPATLRNLKPKELAKLEKQLEEKINKTCHKLKIKRSLALILLPMYYWDEDFLIADYTPYNKVNAMVTNCVEDRGVIVHGHALCSICARVLQSVVLDCGHRICDECMSGLILEGTYIPLLCPLFMCMKFVNCSNLTEDAKDIYIKSLLVDMHQRTNNPKRWSLWEHKKSIFAVVTTGVLVGYCFYKAKKWEGENPIKLAIFRSGVRVYKNVGKCQNYLTDLWTSAHASVKDKKLVIEM